MSRKTKKDVMTMSLEMFTVIEKAISNMQYVMVIK